MVVRNAGPAPALAPALHGQPRILSGRGEGRVRVRGRTARLHVARRRLARRARALAVGAGRRGPAPGVADADVNRSRPALSLPASVSLPRPMRSVRLGRGEDGRTGEEPSAFGTPLAPDLVVVYGPLGLDQVRQREAGPDELPDAVAQGAVLFDVDGCAVVVMLHIRATIEVRVHRDEAVRTRIVQE